MHRITLLLGLLLIGCPSGADDHGHDHAEGDEAHDDHEGQGDHENPGDADDHGHDHGSERVGWTSFTGKTQLFAEYTPLHANEWASFRIHLTTLEDWRPVTGKSVRVGVETEAGPSAHEAREVAPGIFEVRLRPKAKGKATLRVITMFDQPDTHTREVVISAEGDHDELHEGHDEEGAHEHDEEELIAFTLEQQWSIEFGLAEIEVAKVRPTFDAYGSLEPRLGGEGVVYADSRGRITGDEVPSLGARVERGQTLAWLTPSIAEQGDFASLDLAVRQAETRLRAAKVERDRLARLADDGVIPRRRLVDADFAVEEAQSNLQAARSRVSQARGVTSTGRRPAGSVAMKAPIDGIVVGVDVPPGLIVEQGRPLFRIVDADPIWLRVDVPEVHVSNLEKVSGAWFDVAGFDEPFERFDVPVSVGGTVDEKSRTLPLIIEVPNPDLQLRPGMFANVHVVDGEPYDSVVIPNDAIVYEEGIPVAYVMVNAENFERRPLRLGERSAGTVAVERGLEADEWVVTDGSFAVRLAALGDNATAGHGHQH